MEFIQSLPKPLCESFYEATLHEEPLLEEPLLEEPLLEEPPSFDANEFICAFAEDPIEFNYMIFNDLTQDNHYEIFMFILENGPLETPYFAKFLANLFRCLKLPYYEEGLEDIIGKMFELFHIALDMVNACEDEDEKLHLEVEYKFSVVDFFRSLLENNKFVYTDELPECFDDVILNSELIDILDINPDFLASEELVEQGITSNRITNKYIESRAGINDVIGRSTKTDTLVRLLSCNFYTEDAVNVLIDSFCAMRYMYIYTNDFYDAFAKIVNQYMSMNDKKGLDINTKLVRIVTMLVNSNTPINRIDYEIAQGVNGNEDMIRSVFEISNAIDQKNAAEKDTDKHLPGIGKQTFFRFAVYAFIDNMFEDVSGFLSSQDENEVFVGVMLMILRKDYSIFGLEINHTIGQQTSTQNVFEFLNTIARSENQVLWTRILAEMLIANPSQFTDEHFEQLLRVDEFAFEEQHIVDRYASYVIANMESLTQSKELIMEILKGSPIMTPTILKVIAML